MNMKLSKRDIKLLLILLGLVAVVASFYLVYTPAKERCEAIETQNVELQNQVSRLEELNASKAEYEQSIIDMNQEITALTSEFPAATKEEDGVYFAHLMETNVSGDVSISAVTLGNPEVVLVTEVVNGATEETVDAATVEGGAATTVSEYTMYRTRNAFIYSTGYNGLKNLVNTINNQMDKITIQTLSVSYDTATGLLSGTVDTNFFTMEGTEREYTKPNLPQVNEGTSNIFKTNEY